MKVKKDCELNKSSEIKYCECGCGQIVHNRFALGHNKGHCMPHSEQTKILLREKRKLQVCSEETRQKMSDSLKGHKGYWEGKTHSEETKKKISESMKGKGSYCRTEETLKRQSDSHKNPSDEIRTKMKNRQNRLWKDRKYKDDQVKAIIKGSYPEGPNVLEKKFFEILQSLYPNEWKFVGDGQMIINGKCPDFVNVNGQKKIIELFGDYWHDGDDPKDRAKIFKPFGYQTLVIWEHELKNMDSVKFRIKKFSEKRNKCQD